MAFTGLFELRCHADLVRKLRYDLERMEKSSNDQYAAFDFFVTADHIVDWLHPTDEPARRKLRSGPLLRIASHLANGSKHFEATAKHHRSVAGTEKFRSVEEGYVDPDYIQEPLLIHFTPDEAKEFGIPSIDAVLLARRILEFWVGHVPAV